MPIFKYEGYGEDGQIENGTLNAASERLAFDILQSRGLTVFALANDDGEAGQDVPWYKRDIRFSDGLLPTDVQASTAELLATLFSSGLSEREVLRIAAVSTENRAVRRHLQRALVLLEDGDRLADAFSKNNTLFSPLFNAFLRLGEDANELSGMMRSLATLLRKQSKSKQKILGALIYPAILIIAAVILLLVVTFYLAPNLIPLFTSVGATPPATLGGLMALNEFLASNWFWITGATILVGLLLLGSITHPDARKRLQTLFLGAPILGSVLRLNALSQIAGALVLLLRAGETLPAALRTTSLAFSTRGLFNACLSEAADALEGGGRAADRIDEEAKIPATFREMFRVGEETNSLPDTLAAVAETFALQADRQTERLITLLTPLMTLILGLGIGVLIYTLMGAILEVNELAF